MNAIANVQQLPNDLTNCNPKLEARNGQNEAKTQNSKPENTTVMGWSWRGTKRPEKIRSLSYIYICIQLIRVIRKQRLRNSGAAVSRANKTSYMSKRDANAKKKDN